MAPESSASPDGGVSPDDSASPDSGASLDAGAAGCPRASAVPGIAPDDPLQRGIDLALQAVWLFLDSDFERIEALLHGKRRRLLYASEGYAAIQYVRASMAFTQEAMAGALAATESTVNLAMHFRKPRGVGSVLSRPGSRAETPQAAGASPAPSSGAATDTSTASASWLRMMRDKKQRQQGAGGDPAPAGEQEQQPFDPELLDAKFSDLQTPSAGNGSDNDDDDNDDSQALDRPQQRSWASGIATMADSVIGVVRSGTQAIGISRPEWHALKAMTPTQRHAELVHAEAYLMRAMLNIGMGDGVMALLKEGWHVRSAYATYRNCYAYIQDAHAAGERIDDHFVSGTYLGMGVFNIVLSMLPAKLLRFVELVGFSADRRLGLELLAVAAGWRANPLTAGLIGPPPAAAAQPHPCGYGLRSEFCSIVLLGYHFFFCGDLFLGYPNLPLADAVLQRSLRQHPDGLILRYFEGRSLVVRAQLDDAIRVFDRLVQQARGAVGSAPPPPPPRTSALIERLAALAVEGPPAKDAPAKGAQPPPPLPPRDKTSDSATDWRQLQYLGYWERSLCQMALGRWMDAAQGFDALRRENNWNKAVYTYALACCVWERYLELSGAPEDTAGLADEPKQLLGIARGLMALIPTLKRKVAGKSIPIEKFVIRKASKFREQGDFLARPGLELLHVFNLLAKTPRDRLLALRSEVDRDIETLARFGPVIRAPDNPYRHTYYYDDLAVLLLTKGCILRELAHPSPSGGSSGAQPELAPVARDTLLRLLRLAPHVWRDHYLLPMGRFHLGLLYLEEHGDPAKRTQWARAQWRCVLGGRPLSSPPFVSPDEYQAHMEQMRSMRKQAGGGDEGEAPAAPGCLTEERILQVTGHPSLTFFDKPWLSSDWRYMPPDWADSRRYSLENMIEVRTFNADNRLQEKEAAA